MRLRSRSTGPLLVNTLALLCAAVPVRAQQPPAAPWRVGGVYRIFFATHYGDFRVVRPPAASGLMQVVLVSGEGIAELLESAQPLWVNARLAEFVQDMTPQASATPAAPQPTTREEAAMRSDLRNLITAEEVFFADSVKYTARIGPGGLQFAVTSGNSLPLIRLTPDGWTATIRNARTTAVCAIFVGSTPMPPATKEGEPKCQ